MATTLTIVMSAVVAAGALTTSSVTASGMPRPLAPSTTASVTHIMIAPSITASSTTSLAAPVAAPVAVAFAASPTSPAALVLVFCLCRLHQLCPRFSVQLFHVDRGLHTRLLRTRLLRT